MTELEIERTESQLWLAARALRLSAGDSLRYVFGARDRAIEEEKDLGRAGQSAAVHYLSAHIRRERTESL